MITWRRCQVAEAFAALCRTNPAPISPIMIECSVGRRGHHRRHDRSIDNSKTLQAMDPELVIHNRLGIVPHLARAGGVVGCGNRLMNEVGDGRLGGARRVPEPTPRGDKERRQARPGCGAPVARH